MIVATILSSLLINYLFHTKQPLYLLIGLFLYQSLISGLLVSVFPLMTEIFPENANFTLMALCYNIAYSLMSFTPVLVTNIAQHFENPFVIWAGLIILSMFALANINNLYDEEV